MMVEKMLAHLFLVANSKAWLFEPIFDTAEYFLLIMILYPFCLVMSACRHQLTSYRNKNNALSTSVTKHKYFNKNIF